MWEVRDICFSVPFIPVKYHLLPLSLTKDIYDYWFYNPKYYLFYISVKVKVKVKLLSRVRLFATPWTVAHYAPLSMGFSRQEYWSGLPFPSPGDLPNPGIEPRSPALQADALTSEPPGKPLPNKVCRCASMCVSSDNSFFWVLDKSPLSGPGRGPLPATKARDSHKKT